MSNGLCHEVITFGFRSSFEDMGEELVQVAGKVVRQVGMDFRRRFVLLIECELEGL